MTSKITGPKELELPNFHKRKRKSTLDEKVADTAKMELNEVPAADLKNKKIKKGIVDESQVSVEKMASKKFEGWRIKLEGTVCGHVKFIPRVDEIFKRHVTVDIQIPKPQQGRHIGRYALQKAVVASGCSLFVAHLRKSNIASKKVLLAAGFKEVVFPLGNQLCMSFKK